MENLRRGSVAGWLVILGVILLLTIAACSTGDDSNGDDVTQAPTREAPDSGGSELRLTANGCTADCTFASDEEFTLAIEIVTIPAGGYVGVQSVIDVGTDLTYVAAPAVDEIVWPDCEPAIALSALFNSTYFNHGCLTGLIPPLPLSFYAGNLAELTLTCSSGSSTTEVRLLASGDPDAGPGGQAGAAFVGEDLVTQKIPKVSNLTIICGA